ncbi:MAG: phosphodiester glycosidase family protein [Gemmatimonadetes bacterium]|nr:phosphodiester glycosidase family protein [Gemmatimonadota bacterium]
MGRGAKPAILLLAAVLAAVCRPAPSSSEMGLREYLAPDSVRIEPIREGVTYHYLWSPRGPWAVHLVEVDLSRCDLGLHVLSAGQADGKAPGLKRLSELMLEAGSGAVAAVNGDLFTPEGQPLGTEVSRGEVRTVRRRPALAWRPGRAPWIGSVERLGDSTLVAGWPIRRHESDGRSEVISGFPELLDGGERVDEPMVSGRRTRHPRSAVGYDSRTRRLWLVVVDGRREGYSTGMSLPELAGLFEALQATEALNLDGGGSSTILIGTRIANRPSDPLGERPVANALLVRVDPAFCNLSTNP